LHIMQTHYPERLGTSLILNVPFLINAFFKLISPFIDPITRKKMTFNPKPIDDGLFTADEMFKDGGWGGSRNFVWDHEKYWKPFVQMCAEIKAKQMARWRKLGARVGCDEWDYKSEEVVDITPAVADAGVPAELEPRAEPEPEPERRAEAEAEATADKPTNGIDDSAQPVADATDNSPAGGNSPDDAPLDADAGAEAEADEEVVNQATAV
jgi:hypothetical protein